MSTLLRIVSSPVVQPVDAEQLARHSAGCGVAQCVCNHFTLGEKRRCSVVPVSAECVCGHALMYHSKRTPIPPCVPLLAVSSETSREVPLRGNSMEQLRMETALEHARQAERVVQMKLSKYRHASFDDASREASLPHALHALQEAFKISLRSLEDIGEARTLLTDESERSATLRHESVCVMRRLMECCEYAQSELTANGRRKEDAHHPSRALPLCPNCDEVLDPRLGKYCSNCGHSC